MGDIKKDKRKAIIKEYLSYVVIIILVILFKRFVFSPIKVNGDSMMNTLHDGDIMILNVIGYNTSSAKRFDIVVIKENKEYIIKRVIGLPGETVEYKDNQLYINGKKMKDGYGIGKTNDFTVKVPEGKFFVLGDNRENSMDSRFFGSFKKKEILGKTKLIIFPFSRFGTKE
ncbi:MAG: signal peptidase I [Bacilli bacterium]|nr:signal peptidase I [Bacilli bacterium]